MAKQNIVEREITRSQEVLNILEQKEKERKAEISRIKSLKLPEWEKKMMLKAVSSGVWGW